MTPLLSIQNLKKYYATQKAVDDISFDIPKGSIFGLLGPNGAGKSTLLRMITGIFYPDSGIIEIEGKALKRNHTDMMGYMPEERGLYKKMKVGEQILYLAQLKGLHPKEAKDRCIKWFERLNMMSWWNKKVSDLSKGMSQKVQFVATVIHQPKLLILDEPFSGLDPINTNILKDEVIRLSKEGTTIIFSTHRMEQVEEICDQIILINLGKKILDGNIKDIRQQFKKDIYEIELADPTKQAPEGIDILNKNQNLLAFHLRGEQDSNEVLAHYIRNKNTIHAFREILPSLNEIFIQLVQDIDDSDGSSSQNMKKED